MIHPDSFIHPKAEVSTDCYIGARTRVWQFASILRGARLGDDCSVASGACLDGSRAGDRCVICHNLAAGPGFLIGNDVFIGPNVTLCNDNWPRAHKTDFEPERFDGSCWAIIIEAGASVGAGAVVMPGVRIGAEAMIAAGAVVTFNVLPGHIWRRDGTQAKIKAERPRMKFARTELERAAAL